MPRSSPIQTSFNAGKWGPRLQGRVDLEKYSSACNELKNFIPTVQGPALKRSGTRFVKTVKDQSEKSRLIPFEFSTEQAYVLELYEGGMRVLKDSGAVLEPTVSITNVSDANPVVVTASNSYTNGDEVYITGTAQSEINGRFFTVTSASGSAFSLTGEDGTGRSTGSGGTAARVYAITDGVAGNALPWLEAELDEIAFVQNGDVLFLAHPNHPPHKITRTAHTSWTSEEIDWKWPPFSVENQLDDVFIEASDIEGSVTLTIRGGNIQRGSSLSWAGTLGATSANTTPVTITTASSHGFSNGDTVWLFDLSGSAGTALNDSHYTISNVTSNTFTLDDTTAPGAAGSGGYVDHIGTYRFTTNMVGSYIKLRELVEAHVPAWKADSSMRQMDSRFPTTTGWAKTLVQYAGNVYQSQNAALNTGKEPPVHDDLLDYAVMDGSNAGWKFYNRGEGYAEITAVAADGLTCTATVVVGLPYSVCTVNPNETGLPAGEFEGQATFRWAESAFSKERGYPRAVAFYEDRLWFAGTNADPQTFWGSQTGDYENFEEIVDRADSAVTFTLASEDINAIEWLAGDQQLLIGTRGGEFVASATSETEAITASNITVRRQSKYGVKPGVQPRFVDSALLFVQRAGERLHQLAYSNDSNRYIGPDMTALSDDILRPSAIELAYQSAPFRQLWVRLADGNLATLTYVNDQDVLGWAQLELGGAGVEVESLAVIPHPDGDQDQVWMVVKRTIDSSTKRYIEYLEKPFASDTTYADAFFVDSGLTYSGSATTTITGLDHLEGETVKVFADGVVQADRTVSSGAITIDSASKVQVGLGFDARLQTMRLEAGAADGTAQGRRKRVQQLILRVDQAAENVEYGANFDTMDSWTVATGSTFSGDSASYTMPSGYEREGRIAVRHQAPVPFTLVALMPQLTTESR